MSPILNHLTTFLALLLVTSLCFTTEARPLNDIVKTDSYIGRAIENIVDVINIAGIKSAGGQSDTGRGHDLPDSLNFRDVKDSGPAPGGKGHEFVNVASFGERVLVQLLKERGMGLPMLKSWGELRIQDQLLEEKGISNC